MTESYNNVGVLKSKRKIIWIKWPTLVIRPFTRKHFRFQFLSSLYILCNVLKKFAISCLNFIVVPYVRFAMGWGHTLGYRLPQTPVDLKRKSSYRNGWMDGLLCHVHTLRPLYKVFLLHNTLLLQAKLYGCN